MFEGSDGFNMVDYGGGIADPNIYCCRIRFSEVKSSFWSRPLPASMVAQELVPLEKGAGKLVVGTL